jgi:hypothetical protein
MVKGWMLLYCGEASFQTEKSTLPQEGLTVYRRFPYPLVIGSLKAELLI